MTERCKLKRKKRELVQVCHCVFTYSKETWHWPFVNIGPIVFGFFFNPPWLFFPYFLKLQISWVYMLFYMFAIKPFHAAVDKSILFTKLLCCYFQFVMLLNIVECWYTLYEHSSSVILLDGAPLLLNAFLRASDSWDCTLWYHEI